MACSLKEDKSEIIISGYSRQRYTHSVPVALLKLIQSFYTLWKKRRLTQGELDEICQLQPGATATVTLHSLRVNRAKLKFYFKAVRKAGRLQFSFYVEHHKPVRFIAGYFHADFRRGNVRHVPWKRIWNEQRMEACYEFQDCFDVHPGNLESVSFDCYYDCQQIKYHPQTLPDFDLTPMLTNGGTFHWDMDCKEYDPMVDAFHWESEPEVDSHWDFEFVYEEGCVFIRIKAAFLPLNVVRCIAKAQVKLSGHGVDQKKESNGYIFCETDFAADDDQMGFVLDKNIWTTNTVISVQMEFTIDEVAYLNGDCIYLSEEQNEKIGIISPR